MRKGYVEHSFEELGNPVVKFRSMSTLIDKQSLISKDGTRAKRELNEK